MREEQDPLPFLHALAEAFTFRGIPSSSDEEPTEQVEAPSGRALGYEDTLSGDEIPGALAPELASSWADDANVAISR